MREPRADKPARVLGYVRVSGAEQGRTGTSLAGQREEIARYCELRGYPRPILSWVEVESAAAGKIERRDRLRALIAEARQDDLIVVSKVDRWSRDIVYCVKSVRELVARGVGWHSISEGVDAATPNGDSTLGIMAWAADQEHRRIRERTVGRRRALMDQGLYVEGKAPYGARRGPRAEHRQLVLVEAPRESALVREAFRLCVEGSSVEQVKKWLEVEGGRRWDKKSVHALLRNRVYTGHVRDSSGGWIPGQVPVIVPPSLFERAQAALAQRRLVRAPGDPGPSRTAAWLLRGLGTCPDCGSRMGSQFGRIVPPWGYYACARRLRRQGCTAPWVLVESADAAAGAAALERLRELRRELATSGAQPPVRTARARDYAAERARLAARRERAIQLATDGAIKADDLRRQIRKLDEDGARIDAAEVEAHREEAGRRPEARRDVLEHAHVLEEIWGRAPVADRRDALRILARRIVLRPEGPEIMWASAEDLAAEWVSRKTS